MQKKAIPELSVDAQLLVKRLMEIEPEGFISYSDLNSVVGRDVQRRGRHLLASARRIIERDEHRLFEPVLNEGLKRMDDSGVLATGKRAVVHIRRTAAKSTRRLGTCLEYERLSQGDRQEFNLTMAMNAAFVHFTKPSVAKALLPRVEHQMPVAKCLEALKSTL